MSGVVRFFGVKRDTMLSTGLLTSVLSQSTRCGDWAELFLEHRWSSAILWDNGELRQRRAWEEAGASLRVIHQGQAVADHTSDLSPDGLRALAEKVCAPLAPSGGARRVELDEPEEAPAPVRTLPHQIPLAEKAAWVKAVGEAARRAAPTAERVLVKYYDYTQEVVVANSEGLHRRGLRPGALCMVAVVVPDGDEVRLGGAIRGEAVEVEAVAREWVEAGREAAEMALRQRGAVAPPEGELPVVFGPYSGFVHEMIGHPLESRHADGIFAGKVGQPVASPLVTLVDDGTLPGLGGSYPFDDEGTPAQRTVLVEDGVLRGFMCDRLGVDVWEVIDAAATKPFGFMKFYPGPGIGGHCIPIDPLYLSWKLKTLNYNARFIELASEINTNMPRYVVQKIADALNEKQKSIKGSKILILGIAYKKDINDLRESPAIDIIRLLEEKGAYVEYNDPYVPNAMINGKMRESANLTKELLESFDCVVITTDHSNYDYEFIARHAKLIVDTKNALKKVPMDIKEGKLYKL